MRTGSNYSSPPCLSETTSLLMNYQHHGDLSLSGAVLTLTAPGPQTHAYTACNYAEKNCRLHSLIIRDVQPPTTTTSPSMWIYHIVCATHHPDTNDMKRRIIKGANRWGVERCPAATFVIWKSEGVRMCSGLTPLDLYRHHVLFVKDKGPKPSGANCMFCSFKLITSEDHLVFLRLGKDWFQLNTEKVHACLLLLFF